ncbi:hypothetical protein [Aquabacterium sp.]|uniref:hypothetical protein n=1 Tax=Aquabacterium sp. TaxID=1872578 RepID=UPI003D6D462E
MTMVIMRKRPFPRQLKTGTVLAVPLGELGFGAAQVAEGGDFAFFDRKFDRIEDFPPLSDLVQAPLAFRVPMVKGEAKAGGWIFLGDAPLVGSLASESPYWNQPVGSNQLRIIWQNQFSPATADAILGMERMAWWMAEQVVQRLQDHFMGRPNLHAQTINRIKQYDPVTGQEVKTLASQ